VVYSTRPRLTEVFDLPTVEGGGEARGAASPAPGRERGERAGGTADAAAAPARQRSRSAARRRRRRRVEAPGAAAREQRPSAAAG
jgi:hypothetical protein